MTMPPMYRALLALFFYFAVFVLVDLYPEFRLHIFFTASVLIALYVSYVARLHVFDRERSRQISKTMVIDRKGNRMYISTL